jgi:excinuclease ABC subunit B
MSRNDVIIVASVSCIYGLGSPDEYKKLTLNFTKGDTILRKDFLKGLVEMQYERNDIDLQPGKFRVTGNTVDVIPGYEEEIVRIELFGDKIDKIKTVDHVTGKTISDLNEVFIFPAKHFVTDEKGRDDAIQTIKQELDEVLPTLDLLEAQRLKQRTEYDLEMIDELGYCSGIENYSRHFDKRKAGEPPNCLLDFFPDDFLIIMDESHLGIPQVHGMYKGDRSRKQSLIENGFRLPSAYDNRPLKFEEFEKFLKNIIYVSATPADYELNSSEVVEQIIRPTGLLDPVIEIKPSKNQMDNVLEQIQDSVKKGFRVLITTLTKRMAEDLADYLASKKVKVSYLHSEIKTLERNEILRQLRLGEFDALVGINLLREGLDLPEVDKVLILDADKEGFLRNPRSLIQTMGRAARNVDGKVVMYADRMTGSMKVAINETKRRREVQHKFNVEHGIIPQTIIKKVEEQKIHLQSFKHVPKTKIKEMIIDLESQMKEYAETLDFESAIKARNKLAELQKELGVKNA